jgi:hypothetical protein
MEAMLVDLSEKYEQSYAWSSNVSVMTSQGNQDYWEIQNQNTKSLLHDKQQRK